MTTFDVEFLAHELASWQRQIDAGSTRLSRFFFLFFFLITTNGKSIDDERHTCVEGEAGQGRLNSSERWHFHTLPLGTLVALAYVFAKVCFVFFFFFNLHNGCASELALRWGLGRGKYVFECESESNTISNWPSHRHNFKWNYYADYEVVSHCCLCLLSVK